MEEREGYLRLASVNLERAEHVLHIELGSELGSISIEAYLRG